MRRYDYCVKMHDNNLIMFVDHIKYLTFIGGQTSSGIRSDL